MLITTEHIAPTTFIALGLSRDEIDLLLSKRMVTITEMIHGVLMKICIVMATERMMMNYQAMIPLDAVHAFIITRQRLLDLKGSPVAYDIPSSRDPYLRMQIYCVANCNAQQVLDARITSEIFDTSVPPKE